MRPHPRKTNPKVVDGKVQRKNRTARSPSLWNARPDQPIIARERPGYGCRHFLKQKDVTRFLSLLPDWPQLSKGLNVILLSEGNSGALGWHRPGTVAVCAWNIDEPYECVAPFYIAHRDILARLDVPVEVVPAERDWNPPSYVLHFHEPAIRAFQLLHILLHELGHHHDRMTSRGQKDATRDEPYAERYARKYARQIWDSYFREFKYPLRDAATAERDYPVPQW